MVMEQRLVKIGVVAEMLGAKPDTLHKRERTGELLPTRKTRAGTRYCAVADLLAVKDEGAPTIAYARVSITTRKPTLTGSARFWKRTAPRKVGGRKSSATLAQG